MENNENTIPGSAGGSGGPQALHYVGIAVMLLAYLIYNHFNAKTAPVNTANQPSVEQHAPKSPAFSRDDSPELKENSRKQEDTPPASSSADGPRRNLDDDQRRHGHTLTKHVGRTDAQLLERLQQETDISSASTYSDKDTAERAVGAAVAKNESKIKAWLDRGGSQKLVLDYFGDTQHPIGRTMHRDKTAHPCFNAKVVLAMNDRGGGYFVLTSYPEAR